MSYKKILSIDGGGIKGIYAAKFLADIEEEYKIRICDYFDLIAGTSTGGIIAAGLALGIPAVKLQELYEENAAYIFKGFSRNFMKSIYLFLKGLLARRYSPRNLELCLRKEFSNHVLGDCETRLVIPTINIQTMKVEVKKTSHHPDLVRDYKEEIVDILLSATAAPMYFPSHKINGAGTYVDGGIGANNPSHLAIVEGMSKCGWDREGIKLLSIGCTEEYDTINRSLKIGLSRLIKLFFKAESAYGESISYLLIGKESYMRISSTLKSGQVGLDNVSRDAINTLKVHAHQESKEHMQDIKRKFLDCVKEPFVPCHGELDN